MSVIQEEVSVSAADTAADLAKAEPAVAAAMGALDTLEKKDIQSCKGMNTPPGGVGEVFSATMILLANIWSNVPVQKNGKVKDVSWGAAKKNVRVCVRVRAKARVRVIGLGTPSKPKGSPTISTQCWLE